jgi:transposase
VLSLSRNGHPRTAAASGSSTATSLETSAPPAVLAPLAAPDPLAPSIEASSTATQSSHGPSAHGRHSDSVQRPDPEMIPKASRRRFTLAYKRAIIAEVDACQQDNGDNFSTIGSILRREGLYYSTLRSFREQMARVGSLNSAPSKSAAAAKAQAALPSKSLSQRLTQLERQKRSLEHKLAQAQAVIEVQKKVSELLGIALETPNLDLDEDEL